VWWFVLENLKIDTLLNLFKIFLKTSTNTNIGNVIFDMCKYYNVDIRELKQEDMEKYLTSKLTENIDHID
jgi:hypothetical protein